MIGTIAIAFLTLAGANEKVYADNCASHLRTVNEIYKCALQSDSRIKSLVTRAKIRSGREAEAEQIPNPKAEVEGTSEELSASIVQPIELGGKRSARAALSQAENDSSLIEEKVEFGEIALDIAQNILRLTQLNTKLNLLNATKKSISNLGARLRAKAVRSPEESTALGLFKMQGTLIETRVLNLMREQSEARLELEASLGAKLIEPEKLELKESRKWPAINLSDSKPALSLRLREFAVKRLEAEARLQRSAAWPELALGPYFSRDQSTNESSVGAKIEFGLPLWNRNRGAIQRADAQTEGAKIGSERALARDKLSLEATVEAYKKLVTFLEQNSSPQALQKSVAESLQLFGRGLIQPSNVIETYRTAFETMEAVQQAEFAAISYYWIVQTARDEVPKEIP